MLNVIIVFIGAGLGGVLRYGMGIACNIACNTVLSTTFPFGTLIINTLGSGLMGVLVGWLSARGQEPTASMLKLLLATGFLGGFTTFSAFSLDALNLWQRGESSLALIYVISSVMFSLIAIACGLIASRAIFTLS